MKWLLWKDFKLSKWWIFANVMIISALGIIGVYLTYFRDFPGIILVMLSKGWVLFWSLFSGAAHYFNEDQGERKGIFKHFTRSKVEDIAIKSPHPPP